MSKIVVITVSALGMGFQLAGPAVEKFKDPQSAVERLVEIIDNREFMFIIVEDVIFEALSTARREEITEAPLPIVVPLPFDLEKIRRTQNKEYLSGRLQKMLGFKVDRLAEKNDVTL